MGRMKIVKTCLAIWFFSLMVLLGQAAKQNDFETEKNIVIKGTVTDATTNLPIEFASVYISGTTIGTETKKDGSFLLSHVPTGTNKLVVSIIGYKAEIVSIDKAAPDLISLKIKLTQQTIDLSSIEIKARGSSKWKDQYEHFKEIFLGTNKFADECTIVNPYIIDFEETGDYFCAKSKERLIIINKLLGYKINCLLELKQDKNTQIISYLTYTEFKELIPSTIDSLAMIKENRRRVFLGSLKHLLQTLANYNQNLAKEGFTLSYIPDVTRDTIPYTDDITTPKLIVYPDSLSGNYWLNPALSGRTHNNGIDVLYKGPGMPGTSRIMIKHGSGAEFTKNGCFLNPEAFYISGKMASFAFSSTLPSNWVYEKRKPINIKISSN